MSKAMVPIWLLSWAILLPVDAANSDVDHKSGLDRLTFGNVAKNKQSRYWAHLILDYCFICEFVHIVPKKKLMLQQSGSCISFGLRWIIGSSSARNTLSIRRIQSCLRRTPCWSPVSLRISWTRRCSNSSSRIFLEVSSGYGLLGALHVDTCQIFP